MNTTVGDFECKGSPTVFVPSNCQSEVLLPGDPRDLLTLGTGINSEIYSSDRR